MKLFAVAALAISGIAVSEELPFEISHPNYLCQVMPSDQFVGFADLQTVTSNAPEFPQYGVVAEGSRVGYLSLTNPARLIIWTTMAQPGLDPFLSLDGPTLFAGFQSDTGSTSSGGGGTTSGGSGTIPVGGGGTTPSSGGGTTPSSGGVTTTTSTGDGTTTPSGNGGTAPSGSGGTTPAGDGGTTPGGGGGTTPGGSGGTAPGGDGGTTPGSDGGTTPGGDGGTTPGGGGTDPSPVGGGTTDPGLVGAPNLGPVALVPEPSSITMLILGAAAVVFGRTRLSRRRRK